MRPLKIGMLLYGEIEHDSRVRREMNALTKAGHSVTVACLSTEDREPYELEGAQVVPIRPSYRALMPGEQSPFIAPKAPGRFGRLIGRARWAREYFGTYRSWSKGAQTVMPRADVWHGHDLPGLLAARQMQKRHGGGLVHDSHELFLDYGTPAKLPGPARAVLARWERGACRGSNAVITVNPSIARILHERYGVDPVVVMNCPPLSPERSRGKLRDHLHLGSRPIVLYHGQLAPDRGVEQLVDALPLLPPDVAVVLLGYGELAAPYAALAAQPSHAGRLFVVPAVPIADLPNWVCDASVGIIAFQPVDRNNVLGTPNKLFEYMEAGVPTVVSDFPEMHRIVTETGAGIPRDTSSAEALAGAIRELLDEPKEQQAARRRSARAAAETTYNWAAQSGVLLSVYERLGDRYGRG